MRVRDRPSAVNINRLVVWRRFAIISRRTAGRRLPSHSAERSRSFASLSSSVIVHTPASLVPGATRKHLGAGSASSREPDSRLVDFRLSLSRIWRIAELSFADRKDWKKNIYDNFWITKVKFMPVFTLLYNQWGGPPHNFCWPPRWILSKLPPRCYLYPTDG